MLLQARAYAEQGYASMEPFVQSALAALARSPRSSAR